MSCHLFISVTTSPNPCECNFIDLPRDLLFSSLRKAAEGGRFLPVSNALGFRSHAVQDSGLVAAVCCHPYHKIKAFVTSPLRFTFVSTFVKV